MSIESVGSLGTRIIKCLAPIDCPTKLMLEKTEFGVFIEIFSAEDRRRTNQSANTLIQLFNSFIKR